MGGSHVHFWGRLSEVRLTDNRGLFFPQGMPDTKFHLYLLWSWTCLDVLRRQSISEVLLDALVCYTRAHRNNGAQPAYRATRRPHRGRTLCPRVVCARGAAWKLLLISPSRTVLLSTCSTTASQPCSARRPSHRCQRPCAPASTGICWPSSSRSSGASAMAAFGPSPWCCKPTSRCSPVSAGMGRSRRQIS